MIESLTPHWQTIADEAIDLDKKRIHVLGRNGKTNEDVAVEVAALGPGWVKGWGSSEDDWLIWGLCHEDEYPLGDAEMPKTVALLKKINGIKVAAISWFRPNTALLPHRHPELEGDCLTYHLGLKVPDYCSLVTGTGYHGEGDGKQIIFDGSEPHYAFNCSDEDRLILYCEFRR